MAGLWRKLHSAADRIDARFGAGLRQTRTLESLWVALLDAVVARQSDRRYLRQTILPALRTAELRRVLFVGVRGYSAGLERFFDQAATEYWTCDIDPGASRYGAPGRHVTADVRSVEQAFTPGFFDAVLLSGVFGWGVNTADDMNRTLAAIHDVLTPAGLLLIGWNTDRSEDPGSLAQTVESFAPATPFGLPHQKTFADVTHTFAWYRKL